MPLAPLKIPAGVFRPGTVYDSKGRWYDTNLVRWRDNAMQPVGGWQSLDVTTPSVAQVDINERCCGMLSWRANDESPQMLLGGPTTLWNYASGVLTDITPAGFTSGLADASLTSGLFGSGAFGVGVFGTGDPALSALVEAQNWAMDNYGEDAVAVAYSDGKIWYWDKSVGGDAAALTNAPVNNLGVVVTPERFVVALGADGVGLQIKWADQDDATYWTVDATHTAGQHIFPGSGQIMAGRRGRNETLIWTDADLHSMKWTGDEFVFAFQQIGSACGAVSRRSMAVVDGVAVWMGQRAFFVYDGFVRTLPSEVGDYVFGDMNRTQASKVWAQVCGEFSEVTWFYPSSGSTECDRYVTYNYVSQIWQIGQLERTAGVDRGALPYPVMSDADGLVYQHEVGDGYGGLVPYAESGPVEIGDGDQVMHVLGLVPDERTLGGVEMSLYVSMYPMESETLYGPYTPAAKTDIRLTGRQVRVRLDQADPGWRYGTPRLLVKAGGRR